MNHSLENILLEIVSGQRKGLLVSIILFLLYILEKLYLLLVFIRIFIYKIGLKKRKKLDCRVVSIGNITAGGTGKTPMVSLLAAKYKRNAAKVVVVSRGYKAENSQARIVSDGKEVLLSKEDAGDEAFMLGKMLTGVPVIIGKDRYYAGKLAIKEFDPDIILLDDGFQHWKLYRNRDIVLIDALNPFGYMHLIPAGLLREPLTGLKRADSIIITKFNNIGEDNLDKICDTIKKYNDNAQIYFARYQNKHIKVHYNNYNNKLNEILGIEYKNNKDENQQFKDKNNIVKFGVDFLADKRIIAFSGIGNPLSFQRSLEESGCCISDHLKYSDHYFYKDDDIKSIVERASGEGVDIIVTTEKDAARLNGEKIDIILQNCILVELSVSMQLMNDKGIID